MYGLSSWCHLFLIHITSGMLICRLGHREQKDEWVPRRVDVFQKHNVLPPDAVISAGSVNSACTAGIYDAHSLPYSKPCLLWKFGR